MKFDRSSLLNDLSTQTKDLIFRAKLLSNLPQSQLNARPGEDRWNALECLAHLNLYGDFYLPQIEEKLLKAADSPDATMFKSGWLGNYFANTMLPKDGRIRKMNTFADKNTLSHELSTTAIDQFVKQQEWMLRLLRDAKDADLSKVKIEITLTRWIKLKLGDTFRFLINHNERHMIQAENAVSSSVEASQVSQL